MATNNFKAFALDPNANVMSQADWEALPALLSGFTAGKASSAQVNKAIRQATTIGALVGQFIANSGADALDNADINGLVTKFTNALTTNLGLGTASKKNIGTGPGQVPDMSAFTSGAGWVRFPDGTTFQRGNAGMAPGVNNQYVTLPRAFSSADFRVVCTWNDIGVSQNGPSAQPSADIAIGAQSKTTTRFGLWQGGQGGFNVDWIAIGVS
ncbi:gp53-like domain-containing protein [Lelliottia nimipressuralis]|jgi:hypothetical protein|uniref:Phage tail protein n=1 Tax=Lelliottia nimipressuralis TaxID=69220 RepID=A0ABD4KDN2_9ENTR|nr:phage tail protein [Lelliottia nimipressuralis]MBF4179126.1 phage tail protein [Lelliottia nimipressuralis]